MWALCFLFQKFISYWLDSAINLRLFRLSIYYVSFGRLFWSCFISSRLLNLWFKVIHSVPLLSFFEPVMFCGILSFISDISNLCLRYFLVSLEGGLSVLLIFQGISFCLWFLCDILFSISLISLVLTLSFFYLLWI